jgi:hypothetical protein
MAAVLAYPDTDNSVIRAVPWPILCLDMFVSLGILTMTFVIARNWRKVPGMRHFARIGSVCLLCGIALISLSLAS